MNAQEENKGGGCPYLSESDIERIAENVAEKAADKAVGKITNYVYIEVGKSVIHKILWITGAIIVGVSVWMHSKGFL